jgi:hypothetical protein
MKNTGSISISSKSNQIVIQIPNVSQKMTKIIEILNSFNFKLEGEEEVLIDMSKGEKYKLSTQENLEKILRLLYKYIKSKLRLFYNINKIKLPVKSASLSVLATEDFNKNNKLLFIIPDRGLDALGVFSNVGLIYESTRKASMINYFEMGINSRYSVMAINPNKKKLENLGLPDHYSTCEYFWKELISSQKKINNIIVVAHRNASLSVIKLMNIFREDFKNKVQKIICIDSSLFKMCEILNSDMKLEFENKCTNYILSTSPVGTLVYSHSESIEGCENRSSGTTNPNLVHHLILPEIKKFLS